MSRKQLRRYGGGLAVLFVFSGLLAVVWHLASAGPPEAGGQAAPAADAAMENGRSWKDGPEPYDPERIDADPEYYRRVEPTRVFQRAPIPAGRVRFEELQLRSDAIIVSADHTKLARPLAVTAKPGRPVTFYAADFGHFSNGKQSITVRADERGFAEADFWVTNAGNYRVLIGSPENDGPITVSVTALNEKEIADYRAAFERGN